VRLELNPIASFVPVQAHIAASKEEESKTDLLNFLVLLADFDDSASVESLRERKEQVQFTEVVPFQDGRQ
jgi:hypothetical protein